MPIHSLRGIWEDPAIQRSHQLGEGAVFGIQSHPHYGDCYDITDVRHIHCHSYHACDLFVTELVDQYRDHDRQKQSDGNRDDGEEQGIFHRSDKPFICPQILEVGQSYEVPVSDSLCEVPVRQTYVREITSGIRLKQITPIRLGARKEYATRF